MQIDNTIIAGITSTALALYGGTVAFFTKQLEKKDKLIAEKDKLLREALEHQIQQQQSAMERQYGSVDRFQSFSRDAN